MSKWVFVFLAISSSALAAAEENISQARYSQMTGDVDSLVMALRAAKVTFIGEVHPSIGDKVRAIDFLRTSLAPVLLQNSYRTYLLEHLPSLASPIIDAAFYQMGGMKSDPRGEATKLIEEILSETKGGDGALELYRYLRAQGAFVGGSGVPDEVLLAEHPNAVRMLALVKHFASVSCAYARALFRKERILLYGGALHNDRVDSKAAAQAKVWGAAGPEIINSLDNSQEYLAIDIIPISSIRRNREPSQSPAGQMDPSLVEPLTAIDYTLIQLSGAKRGFNFDLPVVVDVRKIAKEKSEELKARADFVIFLPNDR